MPDLLPYVQVLEARRLELGRLKQAVPARVGMQVMLFTTPTLAAVFAFAAYGSAAPTEFTAPRIFSAIAYFSLMRFPLVFLPFALVQVGPSVYPASALRSLLLKCPRKHKKRKVAFTHALMCVPNYSHQCA